MSKPKIYIPARKRRELQYTVSVQLGERLIRKIDQLAEGHDVARSVILRDAIKRGIPILEDEETAYEAKPAGKRYQR